MYTRTYLNLTCTNVVYAIFLLYSIVYIVLYHMYMLYRRRQQKERLKESETRINTLKSHQNATILRIQTHAKDQVLHQQRITDLTMSIEALYKDESRLSEQVELIKHQIKLVHLEAEAMQSEAQQQYTRVDHVSHTLFIVLFISMLNLL